MVSRLVLVASVLFVADAAAGVPRRFLPAGPDPIDGATAVFEATVLELVAPGDERPGRVRLRVTSDWRRIYRGFAFLGRTIDVPFRGPYLAEPLGATKVAPRTRALFALDAEGELALVAAMASERCFSLTGRAPVAATASARSGTRSASLDTLGRSTEYDAIRLRARYWIESRAFLELVATTSTASTTSESRRGDVAAGRLVDRLDDRDFVTRSRAHRDLVAMGLARETVLRAAVARADSLEARQRLQRILRHIELVRAARRAARAIAARGSTVVAERTEVENALFEDAISRRLR